MVKELKDLETDKPDDIAKELEERAKAREPVPVIEDTEPEKDEPENQTEAPDEGEAAAAPEPSGKQEEPEEPALLKRLRSEYKLEHSYKDEEALLKSHASLRRKLSERDPDAALGRALREAGVSPEDLAEVFKRKSEPAGRKEPSGPPKWNPEWDRHVTRVVNEDTNEPEYRGPPEMVKAVREYEAELDQFRRSPVETIVDRWGIGRLIEERAEQVLLRKQGEQTYAEFMKENGGFIEENRDEIVALTNKGWPPLAAVEHVKLLRETEGLRTASKGEEAKNADIARLAGKSVRRNGAAAGGVISDRDLAKMPLKKAIETRMAQTGESIPESW